jgi:hypothetical protein
MCKDMFIEVACSELTERGLEHCNAPSLVIFTVSTAAERHTHGPRKQVNAITMQSSPDVAAGRA